MCLSVWRHQRHIKINTLEFKLSNPWRRELLYPRIELRCLTWPLTYDLSVWVRPLQRCLSTVRHSVPRCTLSQCPEVNCLPTGGMRDQCCDTMDYCDLCDVWVTTTVSGLHWLMKQRRPHDWWLHVYWFTDILIDGSCFKIMFKSLPYRCIVQWWHDLT